MKQFLLSPGGQLIFRAIGGGLILFLFAACQPKEITLAKVHIQQHEWNKAVAALEKAVAEHPENAEAQFLLGQGYARQGHFLNMNRAFTASLAASTQFELEIKSWRQKYFSEHFNAGVKAAGENNFPAAREAFATAIVIDPKQPEAYGNLAFIHSKLGEFDKALEFYQATLAINPTHAETYIAIADLHNRRHEYEKSVAVLERALRQNPRESQILMALAGVYDCLGKNDDAVAAYQQALQIKPDDQELWMGLARLYMVKHDYAHAIQQYANVLSFDANHFEANYNVGLGYLKMGERLQKKAKALEKKSRAASPADTSARARFNLEARRNFKTALPFLLKAAALDTLHAGAYFNLGVGYTRLDETEKAKEAFKRCEQLQEKR